MSAEPRILVVGLVLATLTVTALAVGWIAQPSWTRNFAAMTGLNVTIGRAAGMSFGYASGLGHASVVASSVIVETLYVLIGYPLFALGWQRLRGAGWLTSWLDNLRATAEARRTTVHRYGIAGLFVFVFTPFWMTGPAAGAILGYLIGLRWQVNLAIVLSSTYAAIAVWAALISHLGQLAAAYNRYALFALVVVVTLLALGWRVAVTRGR